MKSKIEEAIQKLEVDPYGGPARKILKEILDELNEPKDPTSVSEFVEEAREELAELAHEQWSGWMKYLFSKCFAPNSVGGVYIPKWAVDRWTRQMNTDYNDLSAEEKDSDRAEADKFLAVFKALQNSKDG